MLNDAMMVYAGFAAAGFALLAAAVARLATQDPRSEAEFEESSNGWWFHASVLAGGVMGLGLGGVASVMAGLGVVPQAFAVVSTALLLGAGAHLILRLMLVGEALLGD